ncbi:4Fe-4S binding protein [bacterium]|nr:4Fe-4S binding protein [bacterium]MBU1435251.1 4Fe-4S binding protein [bacterium]MBU1502894.1 4Fe-4S binding protein [bacterium]
MNRRELFGSLASSFKTEQKQESLLIRPPYFGNISAFDTECQKCDGKCATLCQEQIIIINADKTPSLNFLKSGCTYCDDCAVACEFGVLEIEQKKLINADVTINQATCLSWSGVMCFSCKDPCLEDAIEFRAMFMPVIDPSKCTACGFCFSRCPTYAIDIKALS